MSDSTSTARATYPVAPQFLPDRQLEEGRYLLRFAQDDDDLDAGVLALVGVVACEERFEVRQEALSYAFLRIFRGQEIDPTDTAQGVFASFWAIALFAIIAGFITAIGFIFFIIPGLLAVIVFSLGVPAIINERINAAAAVSRCLQLISGSWGVAIGVVLIGLAINLLLVFVVGGISAPGALSYPTFANFSVARSLVQLAVSALVAPLIPALSTALYYQLKGRADGFPSTAEAPPQPYI